MAQASQDQWSNGGNDPQTQNNSANNASSFQQAASASQTQAPTNNNVQNNAQQVNDQSYTRDSRAKMPDLVNLINSNLQTNDSMSEASRRYYETLRKSLEDDAWRYRIKTHHLTLPATSVVADAFLFQVMTHDVGIIVVFTETLQNNNDEDLYIKAYAEARNAAMSSTETGNIRILNVIGIGPEDYDKINTMITDIKNTFISDIEADFVSMNIETIKSSKFIINSSIERVNTFIRMQSPHGIPMAMDTGFTIDIQYPSAKQQTFMINQNNHNNMETMTLAAITAKISFVADNAMANNTMFGSQFGGMTPQKLFLPVITITDIVTIVKSPNLIPVYLCAAYKAFIQNGLWKATFKNFGVKNAVNIGNLVENPTTHTLYEFSTEADVEAFINACCHSPIIVVATNEGRSRIPGIEWFASDRSKDILGGLFNTFTSSNAFDPNKFSIVNYRYPEYIGYTIFNGEYVDSRYVDFLRMVRDNPNNALEFRPLLQLDGDPVNRVRMIRSFSPEFTTKYLVMNNVISFDTMTSLSDTISRVVNIVFDQYSKNSSIINPDGLIGISRAYANGTINGYSGGFQTNANNYNNWFGNNQPVTIF